MATTTYGYEGSIDAAQWARLAGLLGTAHAVAGPNDFKVTAVAGSRRVSIATGRALGYGVVIERDTTNTVDIPAPAGSGQWFLVTVRRNWATNGHAFECLPGAITTAAVPLAAPTTYPTGFAQNPGTLDDQPLAWVWAAAATTTLTLFDERRLPARGEPTAGSLLLASKAGGDALVTIRSGQSGTVSSVDVTLARPTKVLIVHSGIWIANANSAGYDSLQVNDVDIPGTQRRAHNQGRGGAPFDRSLTATHVLPAGTSKISMFASTDLQGVNRDFYSDSIAVYHA